MKYEPVIGLEIHVELLTHSKLFCSCSAKYCAEPNINCCPVCLGLPGALPVINGCAVEKAVTAALALNSEVQELSRFDRKNYYYPDLPKAYQISQYDQPLSFGGWVEVDFPGGRRRVSLERVHLEEEAGKLIHGGDSIMEAAYSLVDYNRAGIPLLEIVTLPELSSGEEARIFLETLRSLLRFTGISDVKMEEGSLRCDANISLRPAGSSKLGTRTEVKNMNSFRAVEQALSYEARRQKEVLTGGGKVIRQTCHWDENRRMTLTLRGKEGSSDYRYFPDPDLLPLHLKRAYIEELRKGLPELPLQRKDRLQKEYFLEAQDATVITSNRSMADYFEEAAQDYHDYKKLANWLQGDLLFQLRETGLDIEELNPKMMVELLELLDAGDINRPTAKDLLAVMLKTGRRPRELVKEGDLGRISGRAALEPLVEKVVTGHPDAVESYHKGKKKALEFLVGKVMSMTGGKADPREVVRLVREKIS